MATTRSTGSAWEQALRMELAEIMDDLDPGWRAWGTPEVSGR